MNAALGSVCLALVVQRAKKCLDFAATCYTVHFVLCTALRGWPASFEWWALNASALVLMAVLGEWLCMRREMREIPLTSGLPHSSSQRAAAGGARGLAAMSTLGSRMGGLVSSAGVSMSALGLSAGSY